MDSIEKGIQSIDEQTKNAIQKHKELLAKTIFETAQKSNSSSASFDKNCSKHFNGLDDFEKLDFSVFNPHIVVEFRDGKAHQVIDTWDKTEGILPNRKVMGTYYVDIGTEMPKAVTHYCTCHKMIIQRNDSQGGNYYSCTSFHTNSITYTCGCNLGKFQTNLYRFFPDDPIYARNEKQRNMLSFDKTLTFQVDNYLNLYHVESGLYLMFHKTSFPDICFYLAREYTQLPKVDMNGYYQIYLSKRLEKLDLNMTKDKYNSVDYRNTLLSDINQLVPETYQRIYTLYNNFRKFQSFNPNDTNNIELEQQYKDSNHIDPKDRIIDGLKIKLNEAIKRCENSEKIISDMVTKFNEKSVNIQSVERERDLLELKLKEIDVEYKNKIASIELNIEKIKMEHKDTVKTVKEEKERESFSLYQRLNEAEAFKSKSDVLEISISSLQKGIEKLELDKARLKDMNNGLVNQLKQEKERNNKFTCDNNELLNQIGEFKTRNEDLTIKNKDLSKKYDDKINECVQLGENLNKLAKKSSNVLENALSDQIDDLKAELQKIKENNNVLLVEKNKVNEQLTKMKKTLSSLMM